MRAWLRSAIPEVAVRRLAAGSSWLLAGSVTATFLLVVQSLLMARFLGPRDFGVMAVVMSFTALVYQIFDARSWETIVSFVGGFLRGQEHEKAAATLRLVLFGDAATTLLAYVVIYVSAPAVARAFLKSAGDANLLRFYALVLPAGAVVGVAMGLLRLRKKYSWLAMQEVAAAAVQSIGVIVLVATGRGLREVVAWFVVSALLRAALFVWLGLRSAREFSVDWRPRRGMAALKDDVASISQFWFASSGLAVLKGLHQNADTLFLGYLLGPAAAGVFRVARSLSNFAAVPATPLYQATYPELSRLWNASNIEAMRSTVARVGRITAALSAAAVLVAWVAAGPLITSVSGPEFQPAVPIFRLLIVGVAVSTVSQYGHAMLMAARQTTRVLWAFGVPLTAQVVGLIVLTPTFGAWGAAFAFIGFSVIRAVMLGAWGRSGYGGGPAAQIPVEAVAEPASVAPPT